MQKYNILQGYHENKNARRLNRKDILKVWPINFFIDLDLDLYDNLFLFLFIIDKSCNICKYHIQFNEKKLYYFYSPILLYIYLL